MTEKKSQPTGWGWAAAAAGLAATAALPAIFGAGPLPAWADPLSALSAGTLARIGLGGIATYAVWWGLAPPNDEQTVNDRDAARYLVGDQRTGKTTLASLWFTEDIRTSHAWTHRGHRYGAQNDRGAAWITTHGARDIAALVPEDRLALYSPPDTPGVNVLAGGNPYASANRVSTITDRMWPDLGEVQKPLLYTATLTVCQERKSPTLWDVVRFCDDAGERANYAIESEGAQRAWAKPDGKAVRGLVARLDRMLSSPKLAKGLADAAGYDLDEIVRQQRVLVADLTQDDTADAIVLAGVLVSMLQQVSVHRAPGAQMYPVYLDEFQSYATAAIETWITEGGKRHVPLTLIHQNRSQVKGQEKLAAAALSCGTIYVMRVNIHPTFRTLGTGRSKKILPEFEQGFRVVSGEGTATWNCISSGRCRPGSSRWWKPSLHRCGCKRYWTRCCRSTRGSAS